MKVLLVRTSALGDIVHCLPVLVALRRSLPEARIAWVVEHTWSRVLAGHPDIERLIVVRTKTWRRGVLGSANRSDMARAIGDLRAFGADVAIDLMGNHKGAVLTFLSGARRRLGAAAPYRREGSSAWWLRETVETPGEHAVDRALALLAPLGVAPAAADFGADRLLADEPPAARSFFAEQLRSDRPLVLIQAGAGWGNKVYPMPWWAQVATDLDRAGADLWLPTAPGEEHLAEEIADRSDGAARPVDATSFAFLAALLRRARLMLGGDTGPIHLAHALGTPVLCLIGPTDPRRNGPYGAPEKAVFHQLPCSGCYKRFDSARACLLSISPRQVSEIALQALSAERQKQECR